MEEDGRGAQKPGNITPAGSVLSVIAEGRWKSALFTTFTLSLTYVESYLLPALRRSDCQRLTVLADTAGYRDSLVEQRSQGVGRDYSVLPVRVKGGIFHPKLVYLEAQEPAKDVLMVGSGNLTYPGSGGNIEVLEVLRPATAASAFNACADFFEQLESDERIQLPGSVEVGSAIARMRAVAATGRDTEQVQFVHCLRTSGLDQFVAAARQLGGKWQELLVLSPYHHPKAEPVLTLAEKLGVSQLAAGVPSREGEPSSFPFGEVRRRFRRLRAVAPVPASKPQRNLHAKWFELRRDGASLVLTGSFNATQASFATASNVECGVLRVLPVPTACWQDAPEPAYRKCEFPQRADAQAPCVYAVIAEGRTLRGNLLGPGAGERWQLTLESADEVLLSKQVVVQDQGQFSVELSADFDPTRAGTLQVTLTRGAVRASGWVQIAQLLVLEARQRRLMDMVRRAAAGLHSADDMMELLDIVAQQANSVITTTALPRRSASGEKLAAGPQVIPASALTSYTPASAGQGAGREDSMLAALNAGAQGLDLLERLFATLLKREPRTPGQDRNKQDTNPYHRTSPGNSADVEEPEEGESSNEEEKRLQRKRRELEKVYDIFRLRLTGFNNALALRPADAATLQVNKLRLLKVWLGVALVYQVAELGDFTEARTFLVGPWLQEVCSTRVPLEAKAWLVDDVCGLAAVQALSEAGKGSIAGMRNTCATQGEALQATNAVRELARRVSSFLGGALDAAVVLERARCWLEDSHTAALVAERVEEALEALAEVLSAPTERQVLHIVLTDGIAAAQEHLGGFSPEVAALFTQVAQAHGQNPTKLSKVDVQLLDRCPNPYCPETYEENKQGVRRLLSDISWRLNKFGAYRCRCGQFLVAQELA